MGVVLVKKKQSSSGIQENGAGYYEVQTDLHADSSIAHIVIIDDDDPGQIGSLQTQPQRSPDAGHIMHVTHPLQRPRALHRGKQHRI